MIVSFFSHLFWICMICKWESQSFHQNMTSFQQINSKKQSNAKTNTSNIIIKLTHCQYWCPFNPHSKIDENHYSLVSHYHFQPATPSLRAPHYRSLKMCQNFGLIHHLYHHFHQPHKKSLNRIDPLILDNLSWNYWYWCYERIRVIMKYEKPWLRPIFSFIFFNYVRF